MDLGIENRLFIVCGATSGFGRAILQALAKEGAQAIAVARNRDKLEALKEETGSNIETLAADLTHPGTLQLLADRIGDRKPDGILVNAAGPPALPFTETTLEDWDKGYHQVLRWKIALTHQFIPLFQKNGYGRFVYIESSSIKQPIETMVLSTAFRLAVAGMVKTLSQEIPDRGITFNLLAPGFHYTPAIGRIVEKRSRLSNIPPEAALKQLEDAIPVKKMGDPAQFASLAVWLLSPLSAYVTGQVFTLDGGLVRSVL